MESSEPAPRRVGTSHRTDRESPSWLLLKVTPATVRQCGATMQQFAALGLARGAARAGAATMQVLSLVSHCALAHGWQSAGRHPVITFAARLRFPGICTEMAQTLQAPFCSKLVRCIPIEAIKAQLVQPPRGRFSPSNKELSHAHAAQTKSYACTGYGPTARASTNKFRLSKLRVTR
jgi:hypothetical protein